MSRLMQQRLHDVLEACQAIGRLTTGLDFDAYVQNEAVRGAVQWHLCIAGEALNRARQLDPELTELLPDLRDVVGMRNRLVHGYYTISDRTVWSTVQDSVPALQVQVAALLREA